MKADYITFLNSTSWSHQTNCYPSKIKLHPVKLCFVTHGNSRQWLRNASFLPVQQFISTIGVAVAVFPRGRGCQAVIEKVGYRRMKMRLWRSTITHIFLLCRYSTSSSAKSGGADKAWSISASPLDVAVAGASVAPVVYTTDALYRERAFLSSRCDQCGSCFRTNRRMLLVHSSLTGSWS